MAALARLRPAWLVAGVWLALVTALVLTGSSSFHDRVELGKALTDATSYAERAKQLAHGDWRLTLGSAFRMPGYPAFLAAFYALDLGPLAARVVQLLGASTYPVLAYLIARRVSGNPVHGLVAALVVSAFVPFYYWTTWLFAEPLSILLVFALLLLLSSAWSTSMAGAAASGLLVAVLTYLKPNHLLLTPLLFIWHLASSGVSKRSFQGGTLAVVVVVASVLPWSVAASKGKQYAVPLTTAQGIDLWIGVAGYDSEARDSLFGRASSWSGLYDPAEMRSVERAAFAQPDFSGRSKLFQRAAIDRSRREPLKVLVIGVSKSLHLLGFSVRHAIDWVYLAFTLAAAAAAHAQRRTPGRRAWAYAWLLATCTAAAQAFLFLPNYRFRVVLCDPLAAVVISLALGDLVARRWPGAASAGPTHPQAAG